MKNVILTEKAYMNLLAEVNAHTEDTTAGLFLGYQEEELWYILECIEPGPRSNFTSSGFMLDEEYIRYRVNIYRRIYKNSIEVVGLWHLHAGYIRMFTASDDLMNRDLSKRPGGSVAAMITLKNGFDMSMFYVPQDLHYSKISWIVGDSLIPKQYSVHQTSDYFHGVIQDKRNGFSYHYPGYGSKRIPEREPVHSPDDGFGSAWKEKYPDPDSNPENDRTDGTSYDEDEVERGFFFGISSFFGLVYDIFHAANDRIYNMMEPFDDDFDGEEFTEEEVQRKPAKHSGRKHRLRRLFRRKNDAENEPDEGTGTDERFWQEGERPDDSDR